MTPGMATTVCALGILGLFALNREGKTKTSKALWIPVAWLAISSTRMVSEWLEATGLADMGASLHTSNQYLDGSPFDRFLLTALLVVGALILAGRAQRVRKILRANGPILLFLLYCGASTLWSDYTDVAFKRWIKALGDFTMVLIVLTDLDPSAAVKRLLTRVGFVLIPASILITKYYTALGRGWNPEGATSFYMGVTTSKNELGGICLLFGLASVWRFGQVFLDKEAPRRTGMLIAHVVVVAMAIWLFWKANTMTAVACFLMASVLVIATSRGRLARKGWPVHLLVAGMLLASISALFLGVGSGVLGAMGRDSTLTGRTDIWNLVLGMVKNPLLGTGFESFWLGPRLDQVWRVYWWHPNEAHNGYIEIFLNLGLVGLALLAVLIVKGYRNIIAALLRNAEEGSLRLAYFVAALTYNFTESAIRIMSPVWICLLLVIIAVPEGWVRKRKKEKTVLAPALPAPDVPCLEEA